MMSVQEEFPRTTVIDHSLANYPRTRLHRKKRNTKSQHKLNEPVTHQEEEGT
jgi:hypothetical protein